MRGLRPMKPRSSYASTIEGSRGRMPPSGPSQGSAPRSSRREAWPSFAWDALTHRTREEHDSETQHRGRGCGLLHRRSPSRARRSPRRRAGTLEQPVNRWPPASVAGRRSSRHKAPERPDRLPEQRHRHRRGQRHTRPQWPVIDGDATEFADCPPEEPCDVGVFSSGYTGVTIKGGTVRELTFGVILDATENSRLSRLALNNNLWSGLIVAGASHSTVKGLSVSGNGLHHRPGRHRHLRLPRPRARANSVVGNGDIGFYVIGLEDSRIDKNTAAGNPEAGILMEGTATR